MPLESAEIIIEDGFLHVPATSNAMVKLFHLKSSNVLVTSGGRHESQLGLVLFLLYLHKWRYVGFYVLIRTVKCP